MNDAVEKNKPTPKATDLRTWLAHLQATGRLAVIREGVPLQHRLAAIAKRLDGKQALQIIAGDEVVDHEFRVILRTMVTFMMEDPRTISSALDTLWVAKAIERIGDHAKNIAEYVIYVVEGRDIRHSKPTLGEPPVL